MPLEFIYVVRHGVSPARVAVAATAKYLLASPMLTTCLLLRPCYLH